MKLVEQLGSGIQRILRVYDRNIFSFSTNFLKVNFPIKNVGDKNIKLNKTQKSIIELIKKDKYITQAEIGINLNKTTRTIERNMKILQDANAVKRIGSDIAGYWETVD